MDQALAAAQQETKNHPDEALAWYSLGDVLMDMNRRNEAIPALTKANALNPKMGPNWYDLGYCLAAQGKFDNAIDALSKSIDLMPKFPNSWVLLLQCYGAQHDLVGAEEKITALSQAPFRFSFRVENALGDLELARGLPTTALPSLEKAISLEPKYAPSWNDLGMVYGQLHQFDKAMEAFTQAIQLEPGNVEVLNNMGYTYFLTGQTDKAIDYY